MECIGSVGRALEWESKGCLFEISNTLHQSAPLAGRVNHCMRVSNGLDACRSNLFANVISR